MKVVPMEPSAERYPTCKGGTSRLGVNGWFSYLLRLNGPSGYGSGSTAEEVVSSWDGTSKVAIVTGAGSGLGQESARVMAARGCHVVLAGRDIAKLDKAADAIRKQHADVKLTCMKLDLTDFKSISLFCKEFLSKGLPLNILLLNAGIMACPFELTADGLEMQFGTNHMGHYLLARKLLPKMVETATTSKIQGRVVAVSSLGHMIPGAKDKAPFTAEAPKKEEYETWIAYGQSKLCNILFARELQARLVAQKADVIATSLHPGCIFTDLGRHMDSDGCGDFMFKLVARPFFKNVPRGAATQVYCCTGPDVQGGEYYTDANPAPSHPWSQDAKLGRKLWEESEELCRAYLP